MLYKPRRGPDLLFSPHLASDILCPPATDAPFLPNPPGGSSDVLPWCDQQLEACTYEETTSPHEPPPTPKLATVFLASSVLEVAPWHPGPANGQPCCSARVNDTGSVELGKRVRTGKVTPEVATATHHCTCQGGFLRTSHYRGGLQ